MVEDLTATWPVIIVGIVIAMVVSLLYIILMRWFAGIMIWFSILGTLGLIGYGKSILLFILEINYLKVFSWSK